MDNVWSGRLVWMESVSEAIRPGAEVYADACPVIAVRMSRKLHDTRTCSNSGDEGRLVAELQTERKSVKASNTIFIRQHTEADRVFPEAIGGRNSSRSLPTNVGRTVDQVTLPPKASSLRNKKSNE